MKFNYLSTKKIDCHQLQELFRSVKWESGNNLIKLCDAIEKSSTVYSAWDDEKLVGLINALDDTSLNVFIPYLVVNPKYQGCGIGSQLVKMIINKYKDYLNVVLISYKSKSTFYSQFGFENDHEALAMFLSN